MKTIGLNRIKTPEEIITMYFGVKSLDEVASMGGLDENGNEIAFEISDFIDGIKKEGIWGFCKPETETIYCWYDNKADFDSIIKFFAHELTHLYYEELNVVETDQILKLQEDLKEEKTCETVVEIVIRARGMAKFLCKQKDNEAAKYYNGSYKSVQFTLEEK